MSKVIIGTIFMLSAVHFLKRDTLFEFMLSLIGGILTYTPNQVVNFYFLKINKNSLLGFLIFTLVLTTVFKKFG